LHTATGNRHRATLATKHGADRHLGRSISIQLDVYRRMSPGARLRVALELTELSRRLVAEGIRQRHPEYSDAQAQLAFLRLWLGDDLFRKAYPRKPELEP
jgi:hypothetical protein